jgi:hypothetical protein
VVNKAELGGLLLEARRCHLLRPALGTTQKLVAKATVTLAVVRVPAR